MGCHVEGMGSVEAKGWVWVGSLADACAYGREAVARDRKHVCVGDRGGGWVTGWVKCTWDSVTVGKLKVVECINVY